MLEAWEAGQAATQLREASRSRFEDKLLRRVSVGGLLALDPCLPPVCLLSGFMSSTVHALGGQVLGPGDPQTCLSLHPLPHSCNLGEGAALGKSINAQICTVNILDVCFIGKSCLFFYLDFSLFLVSFSFFCKVTTFS